MYMFVCMLLMQAFMFLFHISILTYYITKQSVLWTLKVSLSKTNHPACVWPRTSIYVV